MQLSGVQHAHAASTSRAPAVPLTQPALSSLPSQLLLPPCCAAEDDILLRSELDDLAERHPNFK